VDWKQLFDKEGVRWLHCGGIFAALSATAADITIEAMEAARAAGTVISYDLNFRASLWKSQGGTARAVEVNRKIASLVDVMIGNEEDFTAALGFQVPGMDEHISKLDPANFRKMIDEVLKMYPNFKAVATTLRNAKTASINDWGAILWTDGQFYEAPLRENLEIYDRVGGGDSFASGVAYGFLSGKTPQQVVEYGAAHGALAMTTPGDTTMATLKEVESAMKGKGARVIR
jgi:2-dehydro-3-deoxygluconokinase